ncbi:virulence factor BrkB family protein [Vibrio sp. D404a]|uniref:virulence factor BrkB family protein n=1 Tax=unclassified Vibrio TaxID=2614977 RepID=UPI0025574365|nr:MULTISPECIES: virulence factor BrkB family protein [unclassified Vibrio]MDK9737815.1 virulence factor BrkB family protein [Vibrio sp. D404a]MDK9795417.1 virulence factor BrkB family protein [Vibrio sp. D449a]
MNELHGSYKLKIQKTTTLSIAFSHYLIARMKHDRVNVNAGYLAYITLLSIVPMLAVLLSILSSFSVFADVGIVIQKFIINNFVPASGDAVHNALQDFVANTGKMTAVGSGFLFIAAMMLISNIDKNLNYIWRVKGKRRPVHSFSMYWMVLTLGPILVGASIAATSYVTSLTLLQNEAVSGLYNFVIRKLPLILSFFTFFGLYLLVPNKKVNFSHAAAGSLVAALLFELSKKGFAAYITQFPSYQLIYGALAAIPILFVWVYLCWLIVLVGAEVTAALGEREQWSEAKEMVHSTDSQEVPEQGNHSDSTDSKSK